MSTNPAFVQDESAVKKTSNGALANNGNGEHSIRIGVPRTSVQSNGKEYSPYEHRIVAKPITNFETFLHLLKGSLGTGILAMPKAFTQSGWLLGTIATVIIGAICTYCVHLIVKAEYVLCQRKKVPSMTYPEVAQAAFEEGPQCLRKMSTASGHIVNLFLFLYQLGACCVYVVFISENLKAVLDRSIGTLPVQVYMLMFLLPLILINYIRNLKLLAPFSTVANVITLVSFGVVLYYLIRDGPTFNDKPAVGEAEKFPLFFGTVLFALEAIGVIIPLENEMKTPKKFGGYFGVLNKGMFCIVMLYVGIGLMGYLTYGSAAEGSITLNLPDEWPAQMVKILLACAIFISHSLQCYVAIDIVWNQYTRPKLEEKKSIIVWEYIARTIIVIVSFVFAAAIPKLDLFITLVGAFCLSAVGIAFPPIIESFTHWNDYKGTKFSLVSAKNVVLVLFAFCGLVAGTYTAISDIVKSFFE